MTFNILSMDKHPYGNAGVFQNVGTAFVGLGDGGSGVGIATLLKSKTELLSTLKQLVVIANEIK